MKKFVLLVILQIALSAGLLAQARLRVSRGSFTTTGVYETEKNLAQFKGKTISVPEEGTTKVAQVLGETTERRRIIISLKRQELFAYQGDQLIYNFRVSTGKPWTPTPKGRFWVWSKFRYIKMEGGTKGTDGYYYLPNVPYVMFFYNEKHPKYKGYALHGAYWHINFGQTMSHGCINILPEEAGKLYEWAWPNLNGKNSVIADEDNPGIEVWIY